jgi:MFS family permease
MFGTKPASSPPIASGLPSSAWLLAAGLLAAIASGNILTPLLPDIQAEFAVSITTAGVFVGVFGLARLIVDLPSGWLADRFGLRGLALVGTGLIVASAVTGLLAPTADIFIVSRVLAGVGVAMVAMIALSAMSMTTGSETRGRAMSLIQISNNTGIALYPLLGGIIGLWLGWRATFVLTAVLAVVATLFLLMALRRIDGGGVTNRAPARSPATGPVRRPRGTLGALYLGVVANHIHRHGFRNTFIPLFGATALGLGAGEIALAVAAMAVIGILVAAPGAVFGDRRGRRLVIVAGLTAIGVGDLLFLWTDSWWVFLAAAAIVGAGDFFSSSQAAMLSEIVDPSERNRALSGFRFSVDLGALIGPVVVAALLDSVGPSAAILGTSLVLFAAAAAAHIALPRSHPRSEEGHG